MSEQQLQESDAQYDPDCYCASAGLGFSCAASAGELCQANDCDRCGKRTLTRYVPEYDANFCEPCAADPQADPREETP